MESFRGKLAKQLESHKTTRWMVKAGTLGSLAVAAEPDPADLPEEELGLRRSLSWQRGLTEALLSYSAAVASALESLEVAHQELLGAGVVGAGLAPELFQALLAGLSEAQRATRDAAAASRGPLEARRGRLAELQEKVQQFDTENAELKHYEQKVTVLKQEYQDAMQKGRAQQCEKFAASHERDSLDRNSRKLKDCQQAANEAHRVADKALREAERSKGELCKIAQDLFRTAAEGLRRVAATAGGEAASRQPQPHPQRQRPAAAAEEEQPAIERALTPGYAQSLLTSPNLLGSLCQQYLRKYDANGDGMLDFSEALALIRDLQEDLGVPPADRPSEQQVQLLIARFSGDANGTSLATEQFSDWFAFALRATLAKSSRQAAEHSAADTAVF